MSTESDDECEMAYMLDDDDDDDEDDDDYVPGKRDSDSDPDYGKKRKKTSRPSRYVPGKRNRTCSNSSSRRSSNKSDGNVDEDVDKPESLDVSMENDEEVNSEASEKKSPVKAKTKSPSKGKSTKSPSKAMSTKSPSKAMSTKSPSKAMSTKSPSKAMSTKSPSKAMSTKSPSKAMSTKSPKLKSPRTKKQKKQKNSCSEDAEDSAISVRRSSRSSQARSISYADADVSEEDMFEDEDLIEAFKRSKDEAQQAVKKKAHVDDLWSKFKTDVNENDKVSKEEPNDETSTPQTTENNTDNSKSKSKSKELKNKNEKTELKNENEAEPLKDGVQEGSEVKPVETKEEIDSTSIASKKDNDVSSGNSVEKVGTCNPSKEKDGESIESSSSPMDTEEKQVSESAPETQPPKQQEQEKAQVENQQKKEENVSASNNNIEETTAKGEIPILKVGAEADAKSNEEKLASTLPEREVVVIPEKNQPASSRNDTAQETKPESEPLLMKSNPNRSPGINKFLSSGVKKTGGLSSVLNTIEKKKKMTVLDKTKNDWDSYKSEANLEEELKGNRHAGYLDRQEFLQRVDVKQWENEREMRLYTNRK